MAAKVVILFTKQRQTKEIAFLPSRSRKGGWPSLGTPERRLGSAGCRGLPPQQVEQALITPLCLKTANLVQAQTNCCQQVLPSLVFLSCGKIYHGLFRKKATSGRLYFAGAEQLSAQVR